MRGSFLFNRRIEQRVRVLAISAVKSFKIKLLLCFCIALTLFAFSSSVSSIFLWNNHAPAPYYGPASRKGYSIVMNTWKRYDLLKQSIKHYSSCPRLDSVHIVWSEPDPPSDSLLKYLHHVVKYTPKDGHQVKLKFDINKEDSLNNSAPDTMVGFVPRVHWVDYSKGGGSKFKYGGWWSVWWTGTYSMVLSKAAFFHKKYFILYTNQMPTSLKEYITKNRNCEDIAMSFLVANATGAPPIWVKGKIFEIGSTGISSLGGHSEKRSECVNRFASAFGRMPLVSTTVKAVDSQNIWFW
ncbi:GDP-mannose transporter [Stylosanthes scabra]|uniref:GDP-mannose transporter n=1 Tax=Stylosanthes scabra TaxID=79078 RepID=A0ABU6VPV2_9FABA|nr:GDP-mannose transporter [Stylosanthes scabra]